MKSWAWAAVGLLVGAGALTSSAIGCGSGSGTGGTGGSGGSGSSMSTASKGSTTTTASNMTTTTGTSMGCGTLNPFPGAPDCQPCLTMSCCTELKDCDMGTDCANYLNCIANMGTDCETQFPNGLAPLDACSGMNCGVECPGLSCLSNGLAYNPGMPPDPNVEACNACNNEQCCAEMTAITKDYNDQNCTTDPNCALATAQAACGIDVTSSGCVGTAKAAAICEKSKCTDGAGDHLCFAPICDSGIGSPGGKTCSDCVGTNCCAEFEAFNCTQTGPPPECNTGLTNFNMCGMDPNCNGDATAKAAFDCQQSNCMAECN